MLSLLARIPKVSNGFRWYSSLYGNTKTIKTSSYLPARYTSCYQTINGVINDQVHSSAEEIEGMMSVYPEIVDVLTTNQRDMQKIVPYYRGLMEFILLVRNKDIAVKFLKIYKAFQGPENCTRDNMKLANILAWCIELTAHGFEVLDDVIDHSHHRHGYVAWYKRPGVGLAAINDGTYLLFGLYHLIQTYCRGHPRYVSILEIFNEVIFASVKGQAIDLCVDEGGKPSLELFTWERYQQVIRYKGCYLTSYLPATLSLYLLDCHDDDLYKQIQNTMSETGYLFGMQNDFLDCFGNDSQRGTDVQQGKCTWLAVAALQKFNLAQREVMKLHYGRPYQESEEIIRNLYNEIKLPEIFYSTLDERWKKIKAMPNFPPEFVDAEKYFLNLN